MSTQIHGGRILLTAFSLVLIVFLTGCGTADNASTSTSSSQSAPTATSVPWAYTCPSNQIEIFYRYTQKKEDLSTVTDCLNPAGYSTGQYSTYADAPEIDAIINHSPDTITVSALNNAPVMVYSGQIVTTKIVGSPAGQSYLYTVTLTVPTPTPVAK